jgi:uncharacterized protein YkwD
MAARVATLVCTIGTLMALSAARSAYALEPAAQAATMRPAQPELLTTATGRAEMRAGCNYDPRLQAAAFALATAARATGAAPSGHVQREALLAHGSALVWPQVYLTTDATLAVAETRARNFLQTTRTSSSRCALVTERLPQGGYAAFAMHAIGRGELLSVQRTASVGETINVQFRASRPDSRIALVVETPSHHFLHPQLITEAPVTFLAAITLSEPGTYALQFIEDDGDGPLPAARAQIRTVGPEPANGAPHLTPATPPPMDTAPQPVHEASAMVAELNRVRLARHNTLLVEHTQLAGIAQAQLALRMRDSEVSHATRNGTPSERLRAAGLQAASTGENISRGPSLEEAWNGLVESPSHASNMFGEPFNAVGTAVATAPNGETWVLQIFARDLRAEARR